MSTNSACEFIEVEPGKWYYALEHRHAPKDAWNWLEHASAYGPFDTEDDATKHLRDNHANPGGYSSMPFHPAIELSDEWKRLIEEANARPVSRGFGRW